MDACAMIAFLRGEKGSQEVAALLADVDDPVLMAAPHIVISAPTIH